MRVRASAPKPVLTPYATRPSSTTRATVAADAAIAGRAEGRAPARRGPRPQGRAASRGRGAPGTTSASASFERRKARRQDRAGTMVSCASLRSTAEAAGARRRPVAPHAPLRTRRPEPPCPHFLPGHSRPPRLGSARLLVLVAAIAGCTLKSGGYNTTSPPKIRFFNARDRHRRGGPHARHRAAAAGAGVRAVRARIHAASLGHAADRRIMQTRAPTRSSPTRRRTSRTASAGQLHPVRPAQRRRRRPS